ncbi:MAG: VanW family protein [Patescibacteria group bacterium]
MPKIKSTIRPPKLVKKNSKAHYWRMLVAILVFILLVVPLIYNAVYAGKIYPGVTVGSHKIGSLSPAAAEDLIKKSWYSIAQTGWQLESPEGRKVTLPVLLSAAGDPDLTYSLISVDIESTIKSAKQAGRSGGWASSLWQPVIIRLVKTTIPLQTTLERKRILTFLKENFTELEKTPQPAELILDAADDLKVVAEQKGTVLDQKKFFNALTGRINNFSNKPLTLDLVLTTPRLIENQVLRLLPEARTWLKNITLTLTSDDLNRQLEPAVWHKWINIKEDGGDFKVGLSLSRAQEFFSEISNKINVSAQDAKFELQNERVVQFQPSRTGKKINELATLKAIEQAVVLQQQTTVPVVVETTEPSVSTGEVNDLGIKELLGVGRSNFKGSPKNRRHNIKVGADTLNGVLIKPDEEFSLIKALGEISAETGYLPELVIKGNKTIPEYGGGLCQIGTTIFRATLASGLPILERQSHSYRVPYYEPAGTDATIYDPKPDFRFQNDTGNAILIQTKIEGDNLIFEFWGKQDGRIAEQTKPVIFNIVKPLPTKIVETEDLLLGEKKCTERAHVGADAEFTYTVTYPDGRREEKVFKSHYVPWQEVCLVGVPKGTLQQPAEDGSVLPSANTAGQVGN